MLDIDYDLELESIYKYQLASIVLSIRDEGGSMEVFSLPNTDKEIIIVENKYIDALSVCLLIGIDKMITLFSKLFFNKFHFVAFFKIVDDTKGLIEKKIKIFKDEYFTFYKDNKELCVLKNDIDKAIRGE